MKFIACQERISNNHTRLIPEILEKVGSRNKDKAEIEQISSALTLSLDPSPRDQDDLPVVYLPVKRKLSSL